MAVIHRGRLRFAGTPAQLRHQHDADSLEQAFLACIETVDTPARTTDLAQ